MEAHGDLTTRCLLWPCGRMWAKSLRDRSHSIVFRLMAMGIGLVALGFIGRATLIEGILRKDVGALSEAHQLSIANYVAQDIEEKVRLRRDLLERLADGMPSAALNDPEFLHYWLQDRHAVLPLFSAGLMVVSVDGRRLIAETQTPATGASDFSAADWFVGARDQKRFFIGKPSLAAGGSHPVLTMAVPVKDAAGQPAAVLAGATALGAPNFLNLLQERKIGETGGFLLVDPRDGIFIAATDAAKTLKPLPPPGRNPLHDRAMAGFRGTGVTVNIAGVEELSAIVTVPTPGWFVVARLPTEEAFQPISSIRHFFIRNSALVALLVIFLLFVVVRRVLRPLTDVAQQLHGMATGELEVKPLPVTRKDEVGEVAIGFNYLLGTLREKEAALRASEARMAHLAHHDMLTGLPNRAMFEDRLGQALAQAERAGTSFALLYMDLDGFKPINDTYGHDAGDEVLRQVAHRLTAVLRKSDTVARIGGDEFAILLVDMGQGGGDAALIADKCRDALASPMAFAGRSLAVGLSIGIAHYPQDGRGAGELLCHADQAMYAAKATVKTAPA